jgi:ketosteroid isomerase-like protein
MGSTPRSPAGNPEECDRLFAERVNAGDLDALLALYEPGASLVRRDGTVATGHEAIRGVLARLVGMRARITLTVVRVVQADELAMVSNNWRLSAQGADGAPLELTGKATEVVRRRADGGWRFVLDDPFARDRP